MITRVTSWISHFLTMAQFFLLVCSVIIKGCTLDGYGNSVERHMITPLGKPDLVMPLISRAHTGRISHSTTTAVVEKWNDLI